MRHPVYISEVLPDNVSSGGSNAFQESVLLSSKFSAYIPYRFAFRHQRLRQGIRLICLKGHSGPIEVSTCQWRWFRG